MLLSKPYDEGDIVSFKLANGDEVVAKFLKETDNNFVVSKPMIVVPGSQGIGLFQALFTGNLEKSIGINKNHVMMHVESVDRMRDHYIQQTTGIQPVTKGSILT